MLALLLLTLAHAGEVRAHVDWQAHPAMHLTWGFFAPGLTDDIPKKQTWRHQFRQSMYAPQVRESGVRIVLAAAMAAERARNPDQARELILDQLAYVEDFAERTPGFTVAKSPAEVRHLLEQTDQIVLVHSIEGGHLLLDGAHDARFWADRGVALITVMHLRDDELGGAGLNPGLLGPLVNPRGAWRRLWGRDRGLTQRGRRALVELDDAGILVDLSHTTPAALDDALEVTGQHGIAPVITHGKLARLRDTERGVTDAQLRTLYDQGGLFALGLNGAALSPRRPSVEVAERCPGTLDDFALHLGQVREVVGEDAVVGWSSDWNGWTSHSRPTRRCRPPELEIDEVGLAHPGLLPQHWQRLREQGVDVEGLRDNAEAFLRLWERARRRGR